MTTSALFDVAKVARDVGNDIGYTSPLYGFDVNTAAILRSIHAQSPDIDLGVTREGGEIGAGDQVLCLDTAFIQHGVRNLVAELVGMDLRSPIQM